LKFEFRRPLELIVADFLGRHVSGRQNARTVFLIFGGANSNLNLTEIFANRHGISFCPTKIGVLLFERMPEFFPARKATLRETPTVPIR